MAKLKSFITGALLGGAGMYVGLQYHVLQAEEGFLIVPRAPQQRIQDGYADIRKWDAATWTARPQVALALTEYGRGDLITEGVSSGLINNLRDSLGPFRDNLEEVSTGWEPSTTTSAPPTPPGDATRRPNPATSPPVRRGFLPLAELFGIEQPASQSSSRVPEATSITPILPAGVTTPKQVELLPTPGEFEVLPGPGDVYLGPSAPLPSSIPGVDRRRSDASEGWEPIKVQSF